MKRVLIIRSTGFQHLDRILGKLKDKYPQGEICLLTHQHGKPLAEKYAEISNVYVYPHTGAFSFLRAPYEPTSELKSRAFDVVIVPVGNVTGAGFLNVFLFSFRLRAETRLMCNISLEFKPLTRLALTVSLLKGIAFTAVAGVITVVVSLLFLILWIVGSVAGRKA
ncbi:MAG: hypothetical protein HQL05_07605 [Nitrospirae bacterium]|uniref:glycosyltransferase family 9 protein n=1 Tax=Candidatus Magnetobacterium casense TaxID=1455061 RepID=UPI000698C382|nr:hypothetical protein [Candidatus Magnetobacterium casensis]MBF0337685.1 hypothetical protein [Nitrospirota bacterium]